MVLYSRKFYPAMKKTCATVSARMHLAYLKENKNQKSIVQFYLFKVEKQEPLYSSRGQKHG